MLVAVCLAHSQTCGATIAQNVLGGLGSALASVRGGATATEVPGGPRILRRVNSHPLIRVKSFGELSSAEYDELISKLWDASIRGNLDECFQLVKKGAWPNHLRAGSSMQTNALMLAAMHGHDQLIELLVHLGAEINLANNQGMTALHMAAQLGKIKSVKTLIALGADPLARDWMRETPEEKAALAGKERVREFLRSVIDQERASLSSFHHHVHADMKSAT